MVLIIFAAVIGVLVIMFVSIYNGLVRLKNEVERAWANIDVILKQRFDEIPQLVQVIEQFSQYEAGIIEKVTKARTMYGQARNAEEKMTASNNMSLALQGIMAIGENYPEIKSNQNFLQLQNSISNLENMLSDRRELYNQTVANFNTRIEQFPDVLAARILNYQNKQMFQVAESEKIKPNLKMNLPKMNV